MSAPSGAILKHSHCEYLFTFAAISITFLDYEHIKFVRAGDHPPGKAGRAEQAGR
jgi:hypothetical protein